MLPTINCPATCELCGNWMPSHASTCPRNGVHPSQWTLDLTEEQDNEDDLAYPKYDVPTDHDLQHNF